jgi:SAM-dependent methyltransferase
MKCPICRQRNETKAVGACVGYRLLECPACRVVFSDPMKGPGAEWYESSDLYFMGHHLPAQLTWQHKEFIRRHPEGRTLLDVGCGEGVFLSAARDAGFEVWGLDFDRVNIANAKKRYGLKRIFPLSVEAFCRTKRMRFDLVTFYEVLEHMENPKVFLGQVRRLLKPGGRMVLSCPNRNRTLDSMRGGDFPPNHLTRWSASALRHFVESNGFKVECLNVKPFSPEEVSGFLRSRVRLGLARSLAKKSVATGEEGTMRKARRMMALKDALLSCVAVPTSFLAKPLPLQGSGLYCEAVLR